MADIQILSIPYPQNLQARCVGIFNTDNAKEKWNITQSCTARANVLIIDGWLHRSFCIRCAKLKYPDKEKDFDLYGHKT